MAPTNTFQINGTNGNRVMNEHACCKTRKMASCFLWLMGVMNCIRGNHPRGLLLVMKLSGGEGDNERWATFDAPWPNLYSIFKSSTVMCMVVDHACPASLVIRRLRMLMLALFQGRISLWEFACSPVWTFIKVGFLEFLGRMERQLAQCLSRG